MKNHKVITVSLAFGSVLHRIVKYLLPDSRFSVSPQQIRCDCKESMRDKVAYFIARDLRKTMGRHSSLTSEQQARFCSEVGRYIEMCRQRGTPVTDVGAVTAVCSRWKTQDGRDLPFETAMGYYKKHNKRRRDN